MSIQLQNIPPFWTGAAHSLSFLLYIRLLPRRTAGWRFWLAIAAFAALQISFMWATGYFQGTLFNLCMTLAALLSLLPFLCLCRLTPETAVYHCARAFILGGFTASLSWQLYLFCCRYGPLLNRLPAQALLMALFYAGVFFLMYLLERRHREAVAELSVTPLSCAAAVLMSFAIYVISSLSYAPFETPFGAATDAEAFNIRTLVYFGGLSLLYANHVQLCDAQVRLEKDALESILNLQYSSFLLSQDSIDLVNRKYHDLKHQIAILRSDISGGEKLASLDRLESEIRAYETLNKTGSQVLDTILTSKSLLCQNSGIHLNTVADGGALDFMDVVDLSSLFGNALDNAIEAVSCLPDPEQRLISLSVSRQKGFLRIRVENRCREDLRIRDKLPRTSKADRRAHGYGLKSITATVKKYGGSVTVHAADGWFELAILIPLPSGRTPVS